MTRRKAAPPPEWVTVPQASAMTGIPAPTLRWHCRHERGYFHGLTRFDRPNMPANMRAYEIPVSLLNLFVAERRQK